MSFKSMSFGDLKVSCVCVHVSLLMVLASELCTVSAAILLSGSLSTVFFTVSQITLWSEHYICSNQKLF